MITNVSVVASNVVVLQNVNVVFVVVLYIYRIRVRAYQGVVMISIVCLSL